MILRPALELVPNKSTRGFSALLSTRQSDASLETDDALVPVC